VAWQHVELFRIPNTSTCCLEFSLYKRSKYVANTFMDTTPTPAEPESLAVLHEQDARELRLLLLGLAKQGGEMATL
jgi:hypothetical protein